MPPLESMLEGRKNQNTYAFFCHFLLSTVVGKIKWKKATKTGGRVSNLATCSDEAMALWMLENSWEKWSYVANIGNEKLVNRAEAPDVRYTTGRGRSAMKYAGITKEGIARYNQLCMLVSEDRKNDMEKMEQEQFDQYYFKKQFEYRGLTSPESMAEKVDDDSEEGPSEVWLDESW